MYADYGYYQDTFLGEKLGTQDFDRFATKASVFIDYMTMGKAAKHADLPAVKMCCCAVAEQYLLISNAESQSEGGKELKSQTVGRWTKTYSTGSELADRARSQLAAIVREYLAQTGLLYRGVNGCVSSCCECL